MVDQLCAIDNRRLVKRMGKLTDEQAETLRANIGAILDI